MINFILVKDGKVVEYFEGIGHYYMFEEDIVRLGDGTEFGGLKLEFYLTEEEYEIGDTLSPEKISELENNGLKEEYLELTLEQKIDRLNLSGLI